MVGQRTALAVDSETDARSRETLMRLTTHIALAALMAAALPSGSAVAAQGATATTGTDRASCEALLHLRNLTLTYAGLSETAGGAAYCYVKGILPPAIHFHVQLPLPRDWNGRFLKWGDGGKDGDLDFADHRVAEGYAVANSNTGHDDGAEPGSSFAYDNRQAEIDFGYRAVHLTVAAAKTVVRNYYGDEPAYSYFEGCSTGGRQGLMEAQRYPTDFDGIVAGAPANHYQEMNAVRVWLLQRMFRDDFAGALATDTDGDGRFDSVRKLDVLADAVVAACDRNDGVADGVIDDPLACGFDPIATSRPTAVRPARTGRTASPRPRYARCGTSTRARATATAGRSTPASRSDPNSSGRGCSFPIRAIDSRPGRCASAATT